MNFSRSVPHLFSAQFFIYRNSDKHGSVVSPGAASTAAGLPKLLFSAGWGHYSLHRTSDIYSAGGRFSWLFLFAGLQTYYWSFILVQHTGPLYCIKKDLLNSFFVCVCSCIDLSCSRQPVWNSPFIVSDLVHPCVTGSLTHRASRTFYDSALVAWW